MQVLGKIAFVLAHVTMVAMFYFSLVYIDRGLMGDGTLKAAMFLLLVALWANAATSLT